MDIDDVLQRTQTDLFWLPDDATTIDRAEILYLSCPREQGYLNVVLRLDADDHQVPALVDEVNAAHATVSSRWMIVGKNRRPGVERVLASAGYEPAHEHFAYAIDVNEFQTRSTPAVVSRCVASLADLRDWTAVSARAFGRPADLDDGRLAAELERSNRPDARVHRFIACDRATGEPMGAAGLTVHPTLGFGFLWAGGTAPAARHRGAYSSLVAARVERAKILGVTAVGLYARVDTSAPIVARQGFRRHGAMTYWVRPAERSGPLPAPGTRNSRF